MNQFSFLVKFVVPANAREESVPSQLRSRFGHLDSTCESLARLHPRRVPRACLGLDLVGITASIQLCVSPFRRSQLICTHIECRATTSKIR